MNLLVLKSPDIDQTASFYRLLGLCLERHQHDSGPWHYAAQLNGMVFEIYPGKAETNVSSGTRLGFEVNDLDDTLDELRRQGARIVQEKTRSPWGLQAVVEDFVGYRVHLTECASSTSPI